MRLLLVSINMKFKGGLTTVEVLFSLLAVSVFLMAGFQLYSTVLVGTLDARSRSKAANIAYNHLRHIGNTFNMADCPDSQLTKTETPFADENLPSMSITSTITAPYSCTAKLIRIDVAVNYQINGSDRQEIQTIYVQK